MGQSDEECSESSWVKKEEHIENNNNKKMDPHRHNFFLHIPPTKGGFFSESAMCFSNLQISKSPNLQKKLFQSTILNLKFEFPANNSKQQIHISSSG